MVSEPSKAPISALVLSGGGAQAAYEVGVLIALLEGRSPATGYTPLDFGVVTGTSAGSVNASLLLSAIGDGVGPATEYMQRIWLDQIAEAPGTSNNGVFRMRADPVAFLQPSRYTPNPVSPFLEFLEDSAFLSQELFKRSADFFLSDQKIGKRALGFVDLAAFISSDVLMATLARTIKLDRIRHSKKVLKISCTNWRTGLAALFGNQDMTEEQGLRIIQASSAIPGVFPPVEIGGELYADGGVVMNTPLKPAIDAGADILHVIYTDPTLSRVPLPATPNTASTIHRALLMALGTIFKQDIDLAGETNLSVARLHGNEGDIFATGKGHRQLTIHRYNPFEDQNVGWLSFHREDLQRLIEVGFKDGVEHDCVRSKCILPYTAVDRIRQVKPNSTKLCSGAFGGRTALQGRATVHF
jgi:predicted acylesterase/phospholipase RssA